MTYSYLKKIMKDLNTSLFLTPPQKLVFSYEMTKTYTATGCTFQLQQRETNCSLSLAIDETVGQLTVTTFTLNVAPLLEQHSLSLYDAAMVEMVLQGIELIFHIAQMAQTQQIAVTLTKEEADHLSSFYSFFHTPVFQGNHTILILPTTPASFKEFIKKTALLRTKICTELWKRQRDDLMVQDYLQNHPKGTLFKLKAVDQQPYLATSDGKIIVFPLQKNQVSVNKAG